MAAADVSCSRGMRGEGWLSSSWGALVDAFRVPDLRRVEFAWALSITADWVSTFDVGGPLGVGILGLIRMVPAALAAPFLAMPADRYPRQRVMAIVEGARGGLIGAAALAVWLDLPIAVVYSLVTAAAIVSSALRSTQYALLPSLARSPHELVAANVGLATIESEGKKLLVTGVLTPQSLAFHVAQRAQEEGATVALSSFGRMIH